jgi:alpha-L-fucosidase
VEKSLLEAGAWIEDAHDAIYGTRGGPWDPVQDQYGFCWKGHTIYVHLLRGFAGDRFTLPSGGSMKLRRVWEVIGKQTLRAERGGDGSLTVTGIDRSRSPVDTILAFRFDRPIY